MQKNNFVFVILFIIYSFNNGQILWRQSFAVKIDDYFRKLSQSLLKLNTNSFKRFSFLGLSLNYQKNIIQGKRMLTKAGNVTGNIISVKHFTENASLVTKSDIGCSEGG